MSEANNPYWLKLIQAWCAAGRTGLSVPFIVGARTLTENGFEPGVEDIIEFLNELFAYKLPGGRIRIRWCSEVRAFVIGIGDEDNMEDGMIIGNVHVSQDVFSEFEAQTQAEITFGLTKEYAPEVSGGSYSVSRGQWSEYSERDKKFIAGALA